MTALPPKLWFRSLFVPHWRKDHARKHDSLGQTHTSSSESALHDPGGRIERGDTNVTVRLLDRIAAALNVETADLLRVKQERSRAELEQELYSMIRTAREEKLRFLYRIASLD